MNTYLFLIPAVPATEKLADKTEEQAPVEHTEL
mgnify:FL=1